jgi:hypothetical protein
LWHRERRRGGRTDAGGGDAGDVDVAGRAALGAGLASDAQVSSFTGQVSYEIPIELPGGPGRARAQAGAELQRGGRQWPARIGWSFGQVGVRRSLRLGVPSYTSSDELELTGLAGGTLVPIGNGQYRADG